MNRAPFGAGIYGVAKSFFFPNDFYVGLIDNPELGIRYTHSFEDWVFDVAYYPSSEWQGTGNTRQASRYGPDVINETRGGYEERNQFNLRGIYRYPHGDSAYTELGFSAQYGVLESRGTQSDGEMLALGVHSLSKWGNWTLGLQLFRHDYNVSRSQGIANTTSGATFISEDIADEFVEMGLFDFAYTVAAHAFTPVAALSYRIDKPVDWLDFVEPYLEYSAVIKDESSFNDSHFLTLGAAWVSGGWYVQSDLHYANGTVFIGETSGIPNQDRLSANPFNDWQYRFNINFGYYF